MTLAPLVELNDGRQMPVLGFGTYSINDPALFVEAVAAGYRLLDTATRYDNETQVGQGIADAPVPRDELFVTTKLPGNAHGTDGPRRELEASLERLGLDHVDLYLIHWPNPSADLFVETWKAFIELRDAGLTTSIGVSNFLPEHLDRIVAETGVAPAVNQVELHPYFPQAEQRAADDRLGTITQSWTPIGRGSDLLQNPVLAEIAAKHDVSPAQVVLRWHTLIGAAPIPKSATPDRFRSNLEIFEIDLDEDDLQHIAGLETGQRIGGDPRTHEEY
ncbi:aldo/keto reductase [Aeromicrobium stalagmiti]|uniref:aldo/keto reductase n=1 Tax=Aeromicrobium stalagmiti TaxID=2738988 RepID=UPI00156824B2|nr:aldo/keto reductase [Aeromicrobium stalagmiti]NRQ50475.1 aldo/keto reductase [Aeromicrobium stalagmiti]